MNDTLLAPCGLYCGVCGVFMATQSDSSKLRKAFSKAYAVAPEQVHCKGCLSDEKFVYCRTCGIRSCTEKKGIAGCHECDEFPCAQINEFPVPEGKKVILRSVPDRRRLGTPKWVASEELRHQCEHCGTLLFRGAQRCGGCKHPVAIEAD